MRGHPPRRDRATRTPSPRARSDPDAGILSYQPWYTKEKQPLNIEQSRRHGRGFVVKVRGIDNPEMARALIGKEVFVPRDQLPELAPGEYYWADSGS